MTGKKIAAVVLLIFLMTGGNVQSAQEEGPLFFGAVKGFLADNGFFLCRLCNKNYFFDDFFMSHYKEAGHCKKHEGVETCYCCACDKWVAGYKIFSHTAEHKKVLEQWREYCREKRNANDPKPVGAGERKRLRLQADAYRDTYKDFHR